MLRYLIISYISIYCVFAAFLFVAYAQMVPEEEKKTDQPWEAPLDIVLMVVGLIGMLLFLTDLQSATVKFVWRPVSILLAET